MFGICGPDDPGRGGSMWWLIGPIPGLLAGPMPGLVIPFGICGPAEPTRGAIPPLAYIGLLIGAMPGLIGPVRGLGCWRMPGLCPREDTVRDVASHCQQHEWHGGARTWYSALCAID